VLTKSALTKPVLTKSVLTETVLTKSALTEEDVPELGELVLDVLGVPVVPLGRRLDPQRAEQLRGRGTRVAGFPQDRMQSLVSQVVKDQVDYAPGVEGLTRVRTWAFHEAAPDSSAGKRKQPVFLDQNAVPPGLPVST
jgi:hypothetical protein